MSTRTSECRYLGVLVATLALVFIAASVNAAKPETVELVAEDGQSLSGTLWPHDGAPGILLLHQCNSSRAMYDDLGGMLAAAGFKVLAIDFRGFGDSKAEGLDFAQADQRMKAMAGFPKDAEAAYAFLADSGSGVVAGALGASCGGWQVVGLGNAHPELARLGFFSSGLNAEHERDLLRMSDRKFLFVAAKGDSGAARPAGTLAYRAKSRTELLLYEGDAHGHPLFQQDPELAGKMVAFFLPLLE